MSPTYVIDIETTGLDILNDRIVCIGLYDGITPRVFSCDSERELLKTFWAFLGEHQSSPQFVSYNGKSFDSPMLILRSLVHRLHMPWRYAIQYGQTDLMKILFPNGTTFRSKDAVAAAFGLPLPPNAITGADVPRLWQEGRCAEVVQHCKDDILVEWRIYERMKEAGLV